MVNVRPSSESRSPTSPPTSAPRITSSSANPTERSRPENGCTVQSLAKSTPIRRVAPAVEQQLSLSVWLKNWVVARPTPSTSPMASAVETGKYTGAGAPVNSSAVSDTSAAASRGTTMICAPPRSAEALTPCCTPPYVSPSANSAMTLTATASTTDAVSTLRIFKLCAMSLLTCYFPWYFTILLYSVSSMYLFSSSGSVGASSMAPARFICIHISWKLSSMSLRSPELHV